jgi:hypothetical protein
MFKFNFGNKKPNIKQYAVISVILTSIIAALSQCTKVHENNIWDLLDEIQRKYFPQTILNEIFIQDTNKVDRRVKRDVDKAIYDVTPEYDRIISDYDRKYQPKYMEEKNDESVCYTDECKSLAPPMRICASWVDDCY